MAAAYFLLCLAVQASTGAWKASFVAYPDEPAHFVGSVMVRDYLASGLSSRPFPFARNYYEHYPFFAVGYWPPLFYIVTGFWFLAAGVGRFQALLITAAAAAGTAWVVHDLVRRRAGRVAGFCAGILFLSLPEVQRWICAVMVDEMVAFFCLASAACLVRYFDQATFRYAIGCALCSAFAILTKYSGLYVCALPFAAVVCLGRFNLLRKPSLLVQPFVIAAVVVPWMVWTSKLRSIGLPTSPGGAPGRSIAAFPLELFKFFPPGLAVVVALGLLALMIKPRIWRADLAVICLLSLGLLAFLTLSPVEAERRYLLAGAAALLVLSFAGWAAGLEPLTRRGQLWASSVPMFSVVVALPFAATHLLHYPRPAKYPIRSVVAAIADNPAWTDKRIAVAPDLEGPMIAEFAIQDRHRPGYTLERPSKIFATSGWFGDSYACRFRSSAEMLAHLRRAPVDLIVWHERPRTLLRAHERLMEEMLRGNPLSWRKVASFPPSDGDPFPWQIYEYAPSRPDTGQGGSGQATITEAVPD